VVEEDSEFESLGTVLHNTPNMLVFVESRKFLSRVASNPCISSVITTRELASELPDTYGVAVSDNPRRDFFELHNHLATNTNFYWTDFPAQVSDEATIHAGAHIAGKNVRIGRGTIVEAGVTVLERVVIGEGAILRAGCTIGSQGFQFTRIGNEVLSVAHAGGVRVGDRVEIQANSAISRAIFGSFTEIGDDTKLDNLVHVAHNVRIGKRCLIAACAMIAGSTTIGDDVWIGPGASISNEITIGDRARVTIGSVVTRDVDPDQQVTAILRLITTSSCDS